VNQDIPPGPITQRDLEELLPYDSELVQIELDNNQLDQILERATKDWSGKGYWLQISGFAFKHDPRKVEGHRVDAISLLQGGKMMKLPDRPLQAITYKYLVKGGDGYDMLKSLKWVSVAGSLKERLRETLRGSIEPIQPRVDGRICNITELQKRPCAF
jgi:2',3'-cyclic-nucleotide 2'-phosphodiesterase (5'-nucleotidase family)